MRHFETIEELRQALLAFREVYNTTWLIERHGFISPAAPFRQKQLHPSPGRRRVQSGVPQTAGDTPAKENSKLGAGPSRNKGSVLE